MVEAPPMLVVGYDEEGVPPGGRYAERIVDRRDQLLGKYDIMGRMLVIWHAEAEVGEVARFDKRIAGQPVLPSIVEELLERAKPISVKPEVSKGQRLWHVVKIDFPSIRQAALADTIEYCRHHVRKMWRRIIYVTPGCRAVGEKSVGPGLVRS